MKSLYCLVTLLAFPGALQAQQTDTRCPALPSDSGLQWQEKNGAGFISCKAQGEGGGESLNVLLTSRDPDLELKRTQRAESGTFSGQTFDWYIPELAGRNEAFAASRRITVIKLGKDQYAQVWIDAASVEDLGRLQSLAGQLDVSAGAAYLASSRD